MLDGQKGAGGRGGAIPLRNSEERSPAGPVPLLRGPLGRCPARLRWFFFLILNFFVAKPSVSFLDERILPLGLFAFLGI